MHLHILHIEMTELNMLKSHKISLGSGLPGAKNLIYQLAFNLSIMMKYYTLYIPFHNLRLGL